MVDMDWDGGLWGGWHDDRRATRRPVRPKEPSTITLDDELKAHFKVVYEPYKGLVPLLSAEQAHEELRRRRREQPELLRRVDEYLGGNIPEPFKGEPRGVLARHVATPNHEAGRFQEQALEAGLQPLVVTYHGDQFSNQNPEKAGLGKLTFLLGRGRNGGPKLETRIIRERIWRDGQLISELRTNTGEPLTDFHETWMKRALPHTEIHDISSRLQAMGGKADKYYRKVLALYIVHGVLFEDLLIKGKETMFISRVILPAFRMVMQKFGIPPLIVPIRPWDEKRENGYWEWYSKDVKDLLVPKENESQQPVAI